MGTGQKSENSNVSDSHKRYITLNNIKCILIFDKFKPNVTVQKIRNIFDNFIFKVDKTIFHNFIFKVDKTIFHNFNVARILETAFFQSCISSCSFKDCNFIYTHIFHLYLDEIIKGNILII